MQHRPVSTKPDQLFAATCDNSFGAITDFNAYCTALYQQAQETLENKIAAETRTISAKIMATEVHKLQSYFSPNSTPRSISLFNHLKTVQTLGAADNSLIDLLGNIKQANLTKGARDTKLFIALRHAIDLASPLRPLLRTALDETIALINISKTLNERNCTTLCLNMLTLGYHTSDVQDDALSVNTIKALGPAIKELIDANLFSKINFLRLLLMPTPNFSQSTLDKEYFYSAIPVKTETVVQYIQLLAQYGVLNQHNLEVLFKIFALYLAPPSPQPLPWSPDDLLQQLATRCAELQIDRYHDDFEQQCVQVLLQYHYATLNEDELSRIQQPLADVIESIAAAVLARDLRNATQTQLEQAPPPHVIMRLIDGAKLTPQARTVITRNASDLAGLYLDLYRDSLATQDNLALSLTEAAHSPDIRFTYHLVKQTRTMTQPVFTSLITLADKLAAINKLVLLLPQTQRSEKIIGQLLLHGAFATELLRVSVFELSPFPPAVTRQKSYTILEKSLHKRNHLIDLCIIYDFIDRAKLTPVPFYLAYVNARLAQSGAVAQQLIWQRVQPKSHKEALSIWRAAWLVNAPRPLALSTRQSELSPTLAAATLHPPAVCPAPADLSSPLPITRRKSSTPGDEDDSKAVTIKLCTFSPERAPTSAPQPPAFMLAAKEKTCLSKCENESESASENESVGDSENSPTDADAAVKGANRELYTTLLKTCADDYRHWGFFARSSFLQLVKDNQITSLADVIAYAKRHPRSRTARIYCGLLSQRSADPDLKRFLALYFTKFTFSWYQKSTIVEKLIAAKLTTFDDIKAHVAQNPNPHNRAAAVLGQLAEEKQKFSATLR